MLECLWFKCLLSVLIRPARENEQQLAAVKRRLSEMDGHEDTLGVIDHCRLTADVGVEEEMKTESNHMKKKDTSFNFVQPLCVNIFQNQLSYMVVQRPSWNSLYA